MVYVGLASLRARKQKSSIARDFRQEPADPCGEFQAMEGVTNMESPDSMGPSCGTICQPHLSALLSSPEAHTTSNFCRYSPVEALAASNSPGEQYSTSTGLPFLYI